jgi:ankyrin repeat protein
MHELIKRGAEIEPKLLIDFTPLHLACQNNNIEIVHELIKYGALVNGKQFRNVPSCLWVACYRGHTELVKILLSYGADKNFKDIKKKTPLDIAKDKGYTEIIEILSKQ